MNTNKAKITHEEKSTVQSETTPRIGNIQKKGQRERAKRDESYYLLYDLGYDPTNDGVFLDLEESIELRDDDRRW